MTTHCQVDGIGPSDRHPDLVKLELSFPPTQEPTPSCQACRGSRIVPDSNRWDRHHGEPEPVLMGICEIGSDRGAVNGPLDEARADEAPVVAITEGRGPGRD